MFLQYDAYGEAPIESPEMLGILEDRFPQLLADCEMNVEGAFLLWCVGWRPTWTLDLFGH